MKACEMHLCVAFCVFFGRQVPGRVDLDLISNY